MDLTRATQALKARRYDEAERALTAAIDARATVDALLLRSAAREKLHRSAGARDDLLAAVALAQDERNAAATMRVVRRAATRLTKLGAIEAAMTLIDDALERDDGDALKRLKATLSLGAGRTHEGLAIMRTLSETSADHALTLAHWLSGYGDAEGALEALSAAPSGVAGPSADRTRTLARLQALCDLGEHDQARELLASMTMNDHGEALEEARIAIRIGDFEDADQRLRHIVAHAPDALEGWATLADLALWRGDADEALAHVARIAELEPMGPRAHRQRGVALALAGRADEALACLDRALAIDDRDPEALLWRGELRRAEHDLDGSLADIDAGISASHGYPIAGHLSRMLTVTAAHHRENRSLNTTHEDAFAELLVLLSPLLEGAAAEVSPGEPRLTPALFDELVEALEKMAGNRTTRPTYVKGGRLLPLDVPVHTRFAARQIQDLLVARPAEDVLRRLERLADERGHEPTIDCHIGEIHLWLGDADAAEAAFRRAIEDTPEVRWAYVGLCAAEMVRRRWHEALAWCERGIEVFPPPGRTMFAYRGEVYRRMGELERAEEDLRHILELTPDRISGWMNLALTRHARGDGRLLAPTLRRLVRRAPGLVDDGCRELGVDASSDNRAPEVARILEHLLSMMRGNRSSSFVSYFTATGQLRFVPQR